MVEDAKSKGAQVIVGGSPAPNHGSLYYNPTILTNIKDNMEIFRDEVFGPVVPFIKFTEENVSIIISISKGNLVKKNPNGKISDSGF